MRANLLWVVHMMAVFAFVLVIGVFVSPRLWAQEANVYTPYHTYETIEVSTEEFFAALDYEISGLKEVQLAVEAGDYGVAAIKLKEYLSQNKGEIQSIFGIGPLRPTRSPIRFPSADRILDRHYSRGNVSHRFVSEVEWLFNPTAQQNYPGDYDKEWTAWITRFPSLSTLTDTYRLTANPDYAREAIHLMKHFLLTLPVPAKKSETGDLYNDMYLSYNELSTAIRAANWIRALLSLVDSPLLTPEDLVMLLKGLYEHMLRVERYVAATPNWKAVQIGTMIEASVAFPEFAKSSDWRDWGIGELVKEFDKQVYPDGAQVELDPGYHQMVMNHFHKSVSALIQAGLPLPEELLERLAGMARFVVKLSRPDGSLPAFGDASQRQSQGARTNVEAIAKLIGEEKDLLWYATSGKEGFAPEYDSVALEWSGYYVSRTGWDPDALYMAIKAGPYGAAHQNDDKLSFELYAHGQRFLVDPGLYIYDSANPWRKYFVSSLAHNTVVVDGLSQYRRDERDHWVATKPNDARWISTPTYDYFSGTYDSGYADHTRYPSSASGPKMRVVHQRDIAFLKEQGVWLVIDWMTPADDQAHTYEALFQSLLPIENKTEGFVVGHSAGGPTLGIYPVAAGGGSLDNEVVSGQLEPIRRGWIYSASNRLELLPTAVVKQTATGATAQAYLLIAEKGGQKEVKIQPLTMNEDGGIGAVMTTSDGLHVTFIAQKQPGKRIEGGDLETTGRLKMVVRDGETEEVVEIPFDEELDTPSIYDKDDRLVVPSSVLRDVEELDLALLYSQDFETTPINELPDDWILVDQRRSPDAPHVIQPPEAAASSGSGDRLLYVGRTKDTSTETKYASIVFPAAKQHVRVSFDMFATSAPRSLRVTLGGSGRPPESVHPGSANAAIFLTTWDGRLRALVGKPAQQWVYGGYFTPGRWHKVTLDIDVVSQQYNVYIDNDLLPQSEAPIPFYSTEYEDLNTIAFAYQSISSQNNTDPVYIDNIKIWGR